MTNYVCLPNKEFFLTTHTSAVPTSFARVNKQENNNDNNNLGIKTKTCTLVTNDCKWEMANELKQRGSIS